MEITIEEMTQWGDSLSVSTVLRRIEIKRLLREYGRVEGVQTRVARELGVHKSIICRDMQAIAEEKQNE